MKDTSPEALRQWRQVFRRLPHERKWAMLGETFATARALHSTGVLRRDAKASPEAIQQDWLKRTYRLQVALPGMHVMEPFANLAVLREVIQVLERLNIEYALGGSMASSVYGVTRFTQDADFTVAPFAGKEEAFVQSFGSDYYLSLGAVQEAVRQRSSFNVIQTRVGFKVDLFVCKDDPFEQGALSRRQPMSFPGEQDPIFFQSPEDVCLFKLRWYRLGNESSSQQWQDVLGVLSSERDPLDRAYMTAWAKHLGVEDLLDRAWNELSEG